MDLMGIGSLISGIGSIFGGGKDKTNYKRQTRDSLIGTVEGARQMGIHPLAAMGHSVGSPSVIVDSGDKLKGAGEAMQGMAEHRLAREIAKSEIERNNAETLQINAQTKTLLEGAARYGQSPYNYGVPGQNNAPPGDPFRVPEVDQGAYQPEESFMRAVAQGRGVQWLERALELNVYPDALRAFNWGVQLQEAQKELLEIARRNIANAVSNEEKAAERAKWARRLFERLTGRPPR